MKSSTYKLRKITSERILRTDVSSKRVTARSKKQEWEPESKTVLASIKGVVSAPQTSLSPGPHAPLLSAGGKVSLITGGHHRRHRGKIKTSPEHHTTKQS